MQTKVAKWGNSLGIRIPQWMAEQAEINDGAIVEIDFNDDGILIRKNKLTLEEMVKNIVPENLHEEIDTEAPVGGESW